MFVDARDVPGRVARRDLPHAFAQRSSPARVQASWLAVGLALVFGTPFVFADLLGVQRDVYYAIYATSVLTFLALWARLTHQDISAMVRRRPALTLALAALCGALLLLTVLRASSTPHPRGLAFPAEIFWRGVVYGAVDGLVLSSFPILATFAAFSATPLRGRTKRAVVGIGALALGVSVLFTATYHLGYPDFRGSKVRKPIAGDLIWSAPTLVTLNPVGAPLAHVVLHVGAVTHSYETPTFLPPHR
jgi:hypothetical protein